MNQNQVDKLLQLEADGCTDSEHDAYSRLTEPYETFKVHMNSTKDIKVMGGGCIAWGR